MLVNCSHTIVKTAQVPYPRKDCLCMHLESDASECLFSVQSNNVIRHDTIQVLLRESITHELLKFTNALGIL